MRLWSSSKQDGLAREAVAVGFVAHQAVHLGGQNDGFAARVGLEKAAQDGFAVAAGVNVGGIEEIDAEIEGLAKERLAVGFVQRPGVAAGLAFRWRASP